MHIGYASKQVGYEFRLLAICLLMTGGLGCVSIKHVAVNKLGDALAGGGTIFSSDDDPELVKTAAPFSLKLMESLLAESPNHRGLLLAASSGFAQYAYAFVQQDAEEVEGHDVAASLRMRQRARGLYLRARDYALRGLECAHPDFTNALRVDASIAVKKLKKSDLPLAYWAAASWAGATAIIKDNADLISDLPLIQALIDRALELDDGYDQGAIHSFLISYEMSRPLGEKERLARARGHFEQAVRLSRGKQAAPYLNLAESVSVPQQDRKEFEFLLHQALAIDANAEPGCRLANLVMKRRARWLLSQEDNLIETPSQ
jgi:predicted anti-sigma-YlaC factor YlaD